LIFLLDAMQQKVKTLLSLFRLIMVFLMMLPLNSRARSITESKLHQAQALSSSQPDSALMLLRQLHVQAVSKHQPLIAAQSLQQMGQICFKQGHYAQALDFYQHAEQLLEPEKQKNCC
jgi:cytochrome c-type biogenesis protein CcmH/NrfG